MGIFINLPFEELLAIIKKLSLQEKLEVAKLLFEETEFSDEQWNEAIKRKKNFEEGKIGTESWSDLKNRLLN